jgi:hypothetical protein
MGKYVEPSLSLISTTERQLFSGAERTRRSVIIPDWKALAGLGDFDPNYLHLEPELVSI